MERDRWLGLVSAAQLSFGVAGLVIALRRRLAYDFLMLHGRADNVGHDAIAMGTALSAPGPMLIAQAAAVARLQRGSSRRARIALGTLGVTMTGGYLGEALVRRRLRPAGWDRVESPVAAAGLGLAVTMAALAFRDRRR